MALVPASDQGPLREAYRHLGRRAEPEWRRVAEQMLELLPLLERVCAATPVWGLVSLERLCLLAEDNFRSRRYVVIAAQSVAGGYDVYCGTSAHDADGPDAIVEHADSAPAAAEAVRAAMIRSRAWPELR
jgi:hypothetical protein